MSFLLSYCLTMTWSKPILLKCARVMLKYPRVMSRFDSVLWEISKEWGLHTTAKTLFSGNLRVSMLAQGYGEVYCGTMGSPTWILWPVTVICSLALSNRVLFFSSQLSHDHVITVVLEFFSLKLCHAVGNSLLFNITPWAEWDNAVFSISSDHLLF